MPDAFTEVSASRFRTFEEADIGHNVLYFAYNNYAEGRPSFVTGLWLSRELCKTQIEAAHYIPDRECAALMRREGLSLVGFPWLGIKIEQGTTEGIPKIHLPKFMLEDNARFAESDLPLHDELEGRFGVELSVD